ncbi:DoxX family protein [Mucilaginibacter glaciei]|uniref:DoxX family protein n=1 Tax=Mucilaginibacter glaciei TaxID=2772109 RepID=A0A926RZ88_9SPHI|nr:DoxX family protein [Mucilaginibacter glaciei]MBD1391615.1 DoxX family protein [Mucilaginibacter glaciei]
MKMISKLEDWGDRHHPKLVDVIRIVLGAFLLFKGYLFFHNMPFLRDLIIDAKLVDLSTDTITALLYYVTYAHMVGGTLILFGLVTRLASLIQIPIVVAAVFVVNIPNKAVNSELWLSVVVLTLLLLFVIIGSGPISLDKLLTNDEKNTSLR